MQCKNCGGDLGKIEVAVNAVRVECVDCGDWAWIPIVELEYPLFVTLEVPKQLPLFVFDDDDQTYKRQFGME